MLLIAGGINFQAKITLPVVIFVINIKIYNNHNNFCFVDVFLFVISAFTSKCTEIIFSLSVHIFAKTLKVKSL